MSCVLGIVESIQDSTGSEPCKKTVQKITYLLQQMNERIDFDFSIHFYGPYSADLDAEIRYLRSSGALEVIESNRGHLLKVIDHSEALEVSSDAKSLIEFFSQKSPSDLELLATTLYIQRESPSTGEDEIIYGVKKIKGAKYTDEQIAQSIKELMDKDYFYILFASA